MAREKPGTSSTPKNIKKSTASKRKKTVASVSTEVGTPNQSVAAIQEHYNQEQERQKANYSKAKEDKIIRTLRDLTQNPQVSTLRTSDKEKIRGWLTGNIYANGLNLVEASRYLYYRSPIYSKMCNLYADMYCLGCRVITPNYTFQKGLENNVLKQYDDTLSFLDIMNLPNTMNSVLVNMWVQDVSFNLFFHDKTGCMFYNISPSEAIIDSAYMVNGGYCYGFAINMSKWKSKYRQQLIKWLGSPLTEMWKEYEDTGINYIHVPAQYSMVLKQRLDIKDSIIPPLLPYLSQLANLNDLIDTQANADELSFYKMIYLPMEVLNSSQTSDNWKITPDIAIDYFKIAQDQAIPKQGVASAVIPGNELKTIDFSDSVSTDVDRVETSQNAILGSSGGVGALLNSSKAVNNTELIKQTLRAESAYVLAGVLPQIEAWTNMQLSLNLSERCYVSYMPVTIYTKEEYRKNLLEANQYSFSYRLAYGTLLGYTERQTMAQLMFETEVLGLQEKMKYPLASSYTQSGEPSEVGRPTTPDDELSPSGDRTRNS